MILVDIQIPVLAEIYDFALDEEARISEVLEEILEVTARKENISVEDEERMQLFALRQESLLDKNGSLREQGVEAGDRLVLI